MRLLTAFLSLFVMTAGLAPAADVDTSEIAAGSQRVFNEIQIRRPIVVTHANDDSDRIFIASQLGVVHVLPNDPEAEESAVYLDI